MYYILQVSLYEDFHELTVNKVVQNVTQSELEKGLEHYTVYWWRVKAKNPQTGQESEWSVPCWFRIVAEDVFIYHKIDHSYVIYGSRVFGLTHQFVTDYDFDCTIPTAEIGVGLCGPTSGVAKIGVRTCCPTSATSVQCEYYCAGVWVPKYQDEDILFILTEDCAFNLTTEDGIGLMLE